MIPHEELRGFAHESTFLVSCEILKVKCKDVAKDTLSDSAFLTTTFFDSYENGCSQQAARSQRLFSLRAETNQNKRAATQRNDKDDSGGVLHRISTWCIKKILASSSESHLH